MVEGKGLNNNHSSFLLQQLFVYSNTKAKGSREKWTFPDILKWKTPTHERRESTNTGQ